MGSAALFEVIMLLVDDVSNGMKQTGRQWVKSSELVSWEIAVTFLSTAVCCATQFLDLHFLQSCIARLLSWRKATPGGRLKVDWMEQEIWNIKPCQAPEALITWLTEQLLSKTNIYKIYLGSSRANRWAVTAEVPQTASNLIDVFWSASWCR